MYLKSLEIHGFKSFADHIKLDFTSGKTAVIGPNGSGKSNISDAVRWVLGEQSIKALRGGKMEDIIFAGTEFRKPVGFAEVSLTIDNSDAFLAIEFAEVTVTRRLYRSGESEYFINKAHCRLKDIYELFYDTGIGREGYSIVGQGKIDEILSAKSEDRRNIFEEASGIMKYKTRKLETEKKLEQTRQNIVRITDIINELEGMLEPLRLQYETANTYLTLRDELKDLEVNMSVAGIDKAKAQLKELEDEGSVTAENIKREESNLERITALNSENLERNKQLEAEYNELREQIFKLDTAIEGCASAIRLNNEKKTNHLNNAERLRDENIQLEGKLGDSDSFRLNRQKRVETLEKQLESFKAKLTEAETEMAGLVSKLDESGKAIEDMKAGMMDKLDGVQDIKQQRSNIAAHIDSSDRRKSALSKEISGTELEIDKFRMKLEDFESVISAGRKKVQGLGSSINEARSRRNTLNLSLEELRHSQGELKSDLDHKLSRLRLVRELEDKMEGYSRSVRAITQKCRDERAFGNGIHGTLAQNIEVEPKYMMAIEMALGAALQNIITDTEEDAKRAITWLKAENMGRATFLPVSSVKGRGFEQNRLNELKSSNGFLDQASSLLKCDDRFRGIIDNLLGRVAVVSDMDSAISIAHRFDHSIKIVTLEGEVFNPGGSMTGGSREGNSARLIGRRREIEELESQTEALKKKETELKEQALNCISQIKTADEEIGAGEKDLRAAELELHGNQKQAENINNNIDSAKKRLESQRVEQENLDKQIAAYKEQLGNINKDVDAGESEIQSIKKTIQENQDRYLEDREKRDSLLDDITDYRISVNSVLESINNINQELERHDDEKQKIQDEIAKNNEQIEAALAAASKLDEANAEQERHVEAHKISKTELEAGAADISAKRQEIDESMESVVADLGTVNKTLALLKDDSARMEVKTGRIQGDIDILRNKLWDDYQLTYTAAQALKRDIGPASQANRHINELKQQIRDLGPININAIEDYVKTRDRHEFLSEQRRDVENAAEKLVKVISEISSIMKEQFSIQFKLINDNFSQVFSELFDGGKAKLILEDESNILECGIEIQVQPPGKKLQNMMLFSGGERALTAIALLFAILRLKPSPFCILDEIEAALDEANIYKFADYLTKFNSETQFILITHRKGTMEICDTIYGVTMEEKGISKIVSMKIDDKLEEKAV